MKGIDLQSKVAVVSGGGGEIGYALCVGLADAGARVVVLDINTNRVDGSHKHITGLNVDLTDSKQIESYLNFAKRLGVKTLVTVSNEFVSNSSQSPLKVKAPKNVNLFHFSWTYLAIKGQLLLFKNESNIKVKDQVEIMEEVLYYIESPASGVKGYTQMKPGWKT